MFGSSYRIRDLVRMPGIKKETYEVCPGCWSVMVKLRTFKSPRYKCEICGLEFPNKKRIYHEYRVLFNDAMKRARLELGESIDVVDNVKLRKAVVKAIKKVMIFHA